MAERELSLEVFSKSDTINLVSLITGGFEELKKILI